ncbi:hypothetical protein Tco_0875936 [Tanacetum coccineum]|uniref:Arabinogalactan-like protein n=1 Tax=Tanacetum coccineum TaxID=301880 RepID=A0ABQ5BQV4_9ASTR
MESVKLATALTITMIVFMAFTSSGTMAQEFGAAPAPSPSMESAGMALQVPALLAALATALTITMIVFMAFTSSGTMAQEFAAAPAPSPSTESAGMALQVPAALAGIVSLVAYLF